jgi:hypothetical protein
VRMRDSGKREIGLASFMMSEKWMVLRILRLSNGVR